MTEDDKFRIELHRSDVYYGDPLAADRIEELLELNQELTLQLLATSGQAADALDKLTKAEKERDEYKDAAKIWQEDFIQENQRLYVATVKLAIAVEGLHKIADYTHIGEGGQGVTQHAEARIARATLAELEKME